MSFNIRLSVDNCTILSSSYNEINDEIQNAKQNDLFSNQFVLISNFRNNSSLFASITIMWLFVQKGDCFKKKLGMFKCFLVEPSVRIRSPSRYVKVCNTSKFVTCMTLMGQVWKDTTVFFQHEQKKPWNFLLKKNSKFSLINYCS